MADELLIDFCIAVGADDADSLALVYNRHVLCVTSVYSCILSFPASLQTIEGLLGQLRPLQEKDAATSLAYRSLLSFVSSYPQVRAGSVCQCRVS